MVAGPRSGVTGQARSASTVRSHPVALECDQPGLLDKRDPSLAGHAAISCYWTELGAAAWSLHTRTHTAMSALACGWPRPTRASRLRVRRPQAAAHGRQPGARQRPSSPPWIGGECRREAGSAGCKLSVHSRTRSRVNAFVVRACRAAGARVFSVGPTTFPSSPPCMVGIFVVYRYRSY